jgi:hypothetical protein
MTVTATLTAVATGVSPINATVPTGVGGVLIAFGWSNNTSADDSATGFTSVVLDTSIGTEILAKDDAGESGTIAFTRSVTTSAGGVILIRDTSHTFANIENGSLGSGSASVSCVIAQLTSAGAGRTLFEFCSKGTTGSVTFTPPGGAAELFDQDATGNAVSGSVATETVGAGPTGTRTFTMSGSGPSRGGMVALAPATVTYNNALAITFNKLVPALLSTGGLKYSNAVAITFSKLIPALSSHYSVPVPTTGPVDDRARTALLADVGGTGKGLSNVDLFRLSSFYNAALGSSAGNQYWKYLKSIS